MSKGKKLRELLDSKKIVKVGGAFDGLSAKLVEMHDFDAIWAGSFAISATHALPDASIMTMTEFLAVASNMAESCNIPVIADCDTGFGGPGNVSHMVKKYESAGVAAISIEDKVFPKQNSLLDNGTQELLPEKDFVAKIIAAKDAKSSDDFMIIARIEALIAGLGVDEAIKRADAYSRAGCDAILIHSKQKNPDEIFEFTKRWNGNLPIIAIPTSYPSVTLDELIQNKINMVIYANQTLRASFKAMSELLSQQKNAQSLDQVTTPQSTMDEIFDIQQMYDLKDQEKLIDQNLKKMGYID